MPKATLDVQNTEQRMRTAIEHIAILPLSPKTLEAAVHSLLVTGGDTSRRNYSTRLKPATARQAAQELVAVAEAAEALQNALNRLHKPAADTLPKLDDDLSHVGIMALVARFRAEEFDIIAASETDGKQVKLGELPEHLSPPESLAYVAACVFFQATGTAPTRVTTQKKINKSVTGAAVGGPFIHFLSEVFDIRGIQAGNENCAKAAMQAMDFQRSKKLPNVHKRKKT